MSNFLDMCCPNCGDDKRIDIQASLWIKVRHHGTDADASGCGDHEFMPDKRSACLAGRRARTHRRSKEGISPWYRRTCWRRVAQ